MYPFWTSVFTKNKGVPRAGEGVIIPGFNTEDSQVSLSGLWGGGGGGVNNNCIYYTIFFEKFFVSLLANSLLQYECSPMQISCGSPGDVPYQ